MATPSPACTVNSASPPQDVSAGASVSVALATAGATYWFLGVTACDDSTTLSTIQSSLSINQTNKTATFTAPSGLGSAVILTSTVGQSPQSSLGAGYDINGVLQPSFTTTFKVNVLTLGGLRVLVPNETIEQSAFGNIVEINAAIREIATADALTLFPIAEIANAIGGNSSVLHASTAVTTGCQFIPTTVGSVIKGLKAMWVSPGGGVNVTGSLWGTGGHLATGMSGVVTSSGVLTIVFTSPYTVLSGDVGIPMKISLYAPGGGGGYYTSTSWVANTSYSNLNVPILATPLYSFGDAQSGAHTLQTCFALSAAGSEQNPTGVFALSQYFAMEPIFQ